MRRWTVKAAVSLAHARFECLAGRSSGACRALHADCHRPARLPPRFLEVTVCDFKKASGTSDCQPCNVEWQPCVSRDVPNHAERRMGLPCIPAVLLGGRMCTRPDCMSARGGPPRFTGDDVRQPTPFSFDDLLFQTGRARPWWSLPSTTAGSPCPPTRDTTFAPGGGVEIRSPGRSNGLGFRVPRDCRG
mgnify:CR=1 FL=1